MMNRIKCIGINHHVANTKQREKLLEQKLRPEEIYAAFKKKFPECYMLLISTCNRFEIFFDCDHSIDDLCHYFVDLFKISDVQEQLLTFEDQNAIKHIMRVTASLDSMIVGETQITGQIKEAFRFSQAQNACSTALQKIMEVSFSVTKKIRLHTGLGEKSVSIAQSGIDLASRIFEVKQKTVLVIGAGQMAQVASKYLRSKNVGEIIIANRTIEKAANLAQEIQGKHIHLDKLGSILPNVDLVFCATASNQYILTKELVVDTQQHRKNKPLVLVDVCIPRNIEESASDVKGVFRFDIDAIGNLRDENIAFRQAEAEKAETYIAQAIQTLQNWFSTRVIGQHLKEFKLIVDEIFTQELAKSTKKQSWIQADPELHKNMQGFIESVKAKIMIEYKKKAQDELP